MIDVAVTGIGCRFPGDVHSPEEFWNFLLDKGDGMVDIPSDRWDVDRFYDPDPEAPGRMYTTRGGFLTDPLWEFDPEYFGISPREAAIMDPQQRLILEVAVEALDDAGMGSRVAGRAVGVYIGGFMTDNQVGRHMIASRSAISSHTATSGTLTMLSNRLSYVLDLVGPSMTIDTACSSSLVAIHEAAQSIARGESELAIAGGVNAMLRPETFVSMCKGRFLAPDGRCKTFDAAADGYARGEGAGAVILKPLDAAVADGDRVYAVIRATGSNQDGRTSGITVPNPASQEALARRVLREAGLSGAEVGYVEAHGTGTAIGDPLEMQALGGAYGTAPGRRAPLVVGSVKASIGHLEAAAGVASLIKAALVVHHGRIPPQAWLDRLNPAIPFDGLNLRVPTEVEEYPAGYEQRNVAVNGFGYGGTNAHVIMQEAPASVRREEEPGRPSIKVLPISGRTDGAVRLAAARWADAVEASDDVEALCDASWSRRTHHPLRLGLAYTTPADLATQLRGVAAGDGRAPSRVAVTDGERPVFVFSGMGPQWWRMGRDLLDAGGPFARAAEEIDAHFVDIAGWSIIEELRRDAATSRVTRTEVAQPANFLVQVALVAELSALGIEPAAILGHSVGEVSAGYVSGALTLDDALLVSYHRARLQATTAGTGGMLAVGLTEADATAWLDPRGSVAVAAVNSPSSVTLAGPLDELAALAAPLNDAGVFARTLRVEVPYHSALMDPILDEVGAVLRPLAPRRPHVPLYSSVTAGAVVDAEWGAAYWVDNVRRPVRFADAVTALVAAGHRSFVEVGPHPVLGGNIREILVRASVTGSVVATLMRDQDDRARLLHTVAELYQNGGMDPSERPGRAAGPTAHVDLPAYPWQRTHLWSEEPEIVLDRLGDPDTATLLGRRTSAGRAEWEVELSVAGLPWLLDHVVDGRVVLPGAAYLDAALSAAALRSTLPTQALEGVRFVAPLVIDAHEVPLMRVSVEDSTGRFDIHSRPSTASSWTLNATGRLVDASFQAGTWSADLPAGPDGAVPAGPDGAVDIEALYARLGEQGLQYGPSFRRITALTTDPTGSSVRARLDAGPPAHGVHAAHPPVLDAALQAIASLVDTSDLGAAGPVVPAGVRSVRRYGPLPADVTVEVRRLPGAGLRADLALIGPDGVVALELLGVELLPVRPAASATSQLERLWYTPVWEARPPRSGHASSDNEVTLFVTIGSGADARARALAARRPGSVVIAGGSDLEVDHDDAVATWLHRALGDPAVAAVTVVVVPGEGVFPGIESVAGLVTVARTVDWATSARSGAGRPSSDAAVTVHGVVVTERAFALPGDAGGVNLAHAGLVGARRVLCNEQPELRWRHVDTDGDTPIDVLDLELGSFGALAGDDADEVAIRDGIRLVIRLDADLPARLAQLQETAPLDDPEASFRVEAPNGASLADLGLRAVSRRAPGPGEFELRVVSAGLSYKDALKVVGVLTERQLDGTYFGTDVGMECIADVVRIGPGVTRYAVGDRVLVGVRDSLARYLTRPVDGGLVTIAPTVLSDVGCASNLVFLTAHHALVNCARPVAGETVLVHGAAGGVGLAAVQVARRLGATVIGTASTPERREAVRAAGADHVLDSRSLNFVDDVRALTGGRGADVIVSSAPGEILRANLDAAAEFGRIVEVGKADIYSGGVIALGPFTRNLSFISIDIDRMFAFNRPMLHAIADQVHAAFQTGEYVELPTVSYPAGRVRDAFEAVLRSSHIGRVALRFDDVAPEVRPAIPVFPVLADATYLITGGFGAFGLATARWLAGRGARHLALVGRRGATSAEARVALEALRAGGAEVAELLLDVADADAVAEMVGRIGADMPPLRGVFHSAGILDDQPYTELTDKSLRAVVEPKVLGGFNLHRAVADAGVALDAFVCYSSATAMTGTVPQLAYAAANATLDALMHHRRAIGLPALSVNWGALGGGGMAESSAEVQSYLATIGLRPIDMAVAARSLDDCLRLDVAQVAIADVDWARWASTHPATAPTPRVAANVAAASAGASLAAALRAELSALPEEQRSEVVAYMLAEQVAGVLGIPAEAVDLQTALPDLGLDSLMAVELGARINMTYGVEVSALDLTRGGGLTGLAGRMLPALLGTAEPHGRRPPPPPETSPPPDGGAVAEASPAAAAVGGRP